MQQTNVITKEVSQKEAEFAMIASKEGVAPYCEVTQEGGVITLRMEELETFDFEFLVDKMEQFKNLVEKLHSLGIYHGDLHEENVVARGDRLYLIDFGLSEHINLVDYTKETMYTPDEEYIPSSIEELLELEVNVFDEFI